MNASPLDILTRLLTRPERLVCGIMSGTSVDAIDVALLRIRGGGSSTHLDLLHFREILYAEELQNRIFANTEVASSNVNDICLLHTALSHAYAAAVQETCRSAGIDPGELDLIGMHGQTLRHLPETMAIAGFRFRASLQIGNGPMLATLLQTPVVYDFRSGDLALGGQGAPLVPYVDVMLAASTEEHRILLNIGGIANVTVLPRGCDVTDVTAFDTGPGNMLVDGLMRKFYGREYDEDGAIARSGSVNADLLSWLMGHEYYRTKPPKTAGRELFGEDYLSDFLGVAHELAVLDTNDLVATAAEATVRSISRQVQSRIDGWASFGLYISGGGARNRFFVDGLRHALPNARVESAAALGIDPDAKEAMAFAVLANEWVLGNPANIPSATGAQRPALLGALALPA
ncbi:MAG: anhydro-N-acetylmuramic acid kinase [Bacteroidetes bacterium]|nr:anhydro-N-acetylmuramic acid kinase [Bacteroidota bacterium]